MNKVAIYARYSTDMQSAASIEDQIRICEELVRSKNWEVQNCYTDHGISGASTLLRPGIQQLIQDGLAGKFDVLIAEALDRLSRDQEDIAAIYKRMEFAGIKIITLSEGEISNLHIGLKGTMNAMFLKDLADKTRRGLRGRIEKGKSGGGLTYGYNVVRKFDGNGEPVHGEREINSEHAKVVQRIFKDYLKGYSPKKIAVNMNKEGIPCPSGKAWGYTTIYGNRQRGTGILNNELYIGQLVWNKLRYIKNPDTGKRVSRLNPEEEWIRKDVPEMRIVDQELWDQVKEKQGAITKQNRPMHELRRPPNLFSFLLKCGCCGGGYSKVSKYHYGCSNARSKGTCDNRKTIRQDDLEASILNALQNHLMDKELCKSFCEGYMNRMNELRKNHNAKRHSHEKELQKLIKDEDKMIQAICDGYANESLKQKMHANEARQKELKVILENTEEEKVILHPNLAVKYKQEVQNLIVSLNSSDRRMEAAEILRSLIDKITLTPDKDGEKLVVDLYGDLAGILSVSAEKKASSEDKELLFKQAETLILSEVDCDEDKVQEKMVAGIGFEP
ncbi:MAG: recombinase family protein, partial [Alphaproteobacteria bacterium]|nr:recombinase family protein [Alphaproteobacteria bacterium]